jgi:cob(I)alamin adenosyltransferase
MFKINRVYTRSGDSGTTGLVGGQRSSKSSGQICAIGDVDELNASLGVTKAQLSPKLSVLAKLIEFLQQELFDIGSELATPADSKYDGMWITTKEHVENIERLCDKYSEGLPELDSFILPGGSTTAANFHLSRTIARRTERSVISFNSTCSVNSELIKYINRLSDLLFVLARYSLKVEDITAPLWTKSTNRNCPD